LPEGSIPYAQGKPTNVDFQNPFREPVEFSLQARGFCGSSGNLRIHGPADSQQKMACWSWEQTEAEFPKHMIVYK